MSNKNTQTTPRTYPEFELSSIDFAPSYGYRATVNNVTVKITEAEYRRIWAEMNMMEVEDRDFQNPVDFAQHLLAADEDYEKWLDENGHDLANYYAQTQTGIGMF